MPSLSSYLVEDRITALSETEMKQLTADRIANIRHRVGSKEAAIAVLSTARGGSNAIVVPGTDILGWGIENLH